MRVPGRYRMGVGMRLWAFKFTHTVYQGLCRLFRPAFRKSIYQDIGLFLHVKIPQRLCTIPRFPLELSR